MQTTKLNETVFLPLLSLFVCFSTSKNATNRNWLYIIRIDRTDEIQIKLTVPISIVLRRMCVFFPSSSLSWQEQATLVSKSSVLWTDGASLHKILSISIRDHKYWMIFTGGPEFFDSNRFFLLSLFLSRHPICVPILLWSIAYMLYSCESARAHKHTVRANLWASSFLRNNVDDVVVSTWVDCLLLFYFVFLFCVLFRVWMEKKKYLLYLRSIGTGYIESISPFFLFSQIIFFIFPHSVLRIRYCLPKLVTSLDVYWAFTKANNNKKRRWKPWRAEPRISAITSALSIEIRYISHVLNTYSAIKQTLSTVVFGFKPLFISTQNMISLKINSEISRMRLLLYLWVCVFELPKKS